MRQSIKCGFSSQTSVTQLILQAPDVALQCSSCGQDGLDVLLLKYHKAELGRCYGSVQDRWAGREDGQ